MGNCSSSDKVNPNDTELTQNEAVSPGAKSTASLTSRHHITSARNRSCTDVIFLLIFTAFTISLIGLIAYCVHNGNIYRIVNGYDNCGNICGLENDRQSGITCTGANMTGRAKLQVTGISGTLFVSSNVHRECVSECRTDAGFIKILNRCIPGKTENNENFFSKTGISDFLQEVAEDLQFCWREIVYMCLIALLLSIIMILFFRFLAGFVIWVVLVLVAVSAVTGTIFLWFRWDALRRLRKEQGEDTDIDKRKVSMYLAFACVATIGTVIILLVLLVLRKRIMLVSQLFNEAGKAVSKMPFVLLQPFLTFFVLTCVVAIWLVFALCVESSGRLYSKNNENYIFKKDDAMKFTRWYNLLGLFWFCQFVLGCQQMVVAGAVANWFFTRNKDNLGTPILSSFYNLIRYHLGTVAFGSLFIALLQLVRALLAYIENSTKNSENAIGKCFFRGCQCFLYCFEKLLQYLSRNAYIITAMNGYAFCKAGQKAFSLLTNNALRVFAINSVGDFVLILSKVVVVAITVLLGLEILKPKSDYIQHIWVPMVLAGFFAYLIAHAFVSVYEMVIDTIFLCFCVDCEENDGLSKPYYMSRGLMEFVENSKKALEFDDRIKP